MAQLRLFQTVWFKFSFFPFQSSRHSSDVGVNIDTLVASEKETWSREKLSLQKALKQANAEISKLRAELRSEAFLRELGSDSENAVLRVGRLCLTNHSFYNFYLGLFCVAFTLFILSKQTVIQFLNSYPQIHDFKFLSPRMIRKHLCCFLCVLYFLLLGWSSSYKATLNKCEQ